MPCPADDGTRVTTRPQVSVHDILPPATATTDGTTGLQKVSLSYLTVCRRCSNGGNFVTTHTTQLIVRGVLLLLSFIMLTASTNKLDRQSQSKGSFLYIFFLMFTRGGLRKFYGKACPFSGLTNYGRSWRKVAGKPVLAEAAGKRVLEWG